MLTADLLCLVAEFLKCSDNSKETDDTSRGDPSSKLTHY